MKWNVSSKTIEEAKQLIDEGRLHHLQPFHDEAAFRFQCVDDRPYQVILDGTGKEKDFCPCEEFKEKGYCCHTVAGELVLRDLIGTRLWTKGLDELAVFGHSRFSRPQTELILLHQNRYDHRGETEVKKGKLSFLLHSETVRYQQKDVLVFLIHLSFCPKNYQLLDWLDALEKGRTVKEEDRLAEDEKEALLGLYRLIKHDDLTKEIVYQTRWTQDLALPFMSLQEILDWKEQFEKRVLIKSDIHFQKATNSKLFHVDIGEEIVLTVKRTFRFSFEYAGYFTDDKHFNLLSRELASFLEGLAKFWQLLDRGQGYCFQKGSHRSIGESQSSMVQATFPILEKLVDKELPRLNDDLAINLSATREDECIKIDVLFEYGDEISIPIIVEENPLSFSIWRNPEEKTFFERCLSLGAVWKNQAFYFSVKTQADRWKFMVDFRMNLATQL